MFFTFKLRLSRAKRRQMFNDYIVLFRCRVHLVFALMVETCVIYNIIGFWFDKYLFFFSKFGAIF